MTLYSLPLVSGIGIGSRTPEDHQILACSSALVSAPHSRRFHTRESCIYKCSQPWAKIWPLVEFVDAEPTHVEG